MDARTFSRRAVLNMHISLTLLVVCRDHCVKVVGATSSWAFLALIRPYGFFSRRMVCGDYIVYCSLPHGSKVLFLAPSVAFMAALRSRCWHYIIFRPVVIKLTFYLLRFFFSSNLSRRRLNVYHTSTHGMALVRRMQVWNVLHAARWKYRMQKIAKNSPCAHHCTILSDYIFATKA